MTAAEILQRRDWLAYLAQRKGTYEYRCLRYAAVYEILLILGLQSGDLIVDVGAGMCDFDRYIRSVRGFDGRYLPIDGAIQGFDLNTWRPSLRADFYICLETLEHLTDPLLLAWKLRMHSSKGTVITTPNTDALGDETVRSLDATHCTPLRASQLHAVGYTTEICDLFPHMGIPDCSIIGYASSTSSTCAPGPGVVGSVPATPTKGH